MKNYSANSGQYSMVGDQVLFQDSAMVTNLTWLCNAKNFGLMLLDLMKNSTVMIDLSGIKMMKMRKKALFFNGFYFF